MRASAELRSNYRFIKGNIGVLDAKHVQVLDPHFHTRCDNVSSERGMLLEAGKQGIDFLVAANHNTVNFDETRRTRDRLGLEIEIFPGTELTALPLADKHEKHVLVVGKSAKDARLIRDGLSPLMSMFDIVPYADVHGLLVAIAHPELDGISFTEKEVEIMAKNGILPPVIEVNNGGAALIDRHSREINLVKGLPLPARIKDRMPEPGSNAKAIAIYDRYDEQFEAVMGGSDAHSRRRVGDVFNCIPIGMDPISAVRTRQVAVMQRNKLKRVTAREVLVSEWRGRKEISVPKNDHELRKLLEKSTPHELVDEIFREYMNEHE